VSVEGQPGLLYAASDNNNDNRIIIIIIIMKFSLFASKLNSTGAG
jgi:hypothetical protein